MSNFNRYNIYCILISVIFEIASFFSEQYRPFAGGLMFFFMHVFGLIFDTAKLVSIKLSNEGE